MGRDVLDQGDAANGAHLVNIDILSDKQALGVAAAMAGASAIGEAIARQGEATIVVATGMSQLEMLGALVGAAGIDWSKVTVFHLDEYVGLAESHPASFRRYLKERLVAQLPKLKAFIPVEGDAPDTQAEVARLNARLTGRVVDVCFAGIGENCHLAFNDPPADFTAEAPYLVVALDEACRRQQLGEGWFATLADVPQHAISMSIRQIMRARRLIVSVPDARKAQAVKAAVEGEVSPLFPASMLRRHAACTLFLDPPAASLLRTAKAHLA
jgi:glucosamine-6-phosphate deaminase